MITLTTTIQEITMQAYALGVYEYLFDTCNESRDEIFNRFEEWGKEFEEAHKDYEWDGNYYDEIDDLVERKFTEIKLADKFVKGDYIIYETGLYKITGFTYRGILVDEIVPRKGDDDWVLTEIGLSQVENITLVSGEVIMDTSQNHDHELVRKINRAWNEKREEFCPILRALYERDIKEIMDSDAWNWTDDEESVKETLHDDWDIHADNYLMHIADNLDLQTILTFLRYDE